MKLIVGLGNPGNEYSKTRHNIGFMFLDYISNNSEFNLNKKFNAMEKEILVSNEKFLLIKPLSFMNLSGEVVNKYVNFYKLNVNDVVIVQDDLDIEIGKYKLQYNHGDGGHNGIKNIILNLGTKKFLRVKIGISKNSNIGTKDYVLGKFTENELQILSGLFANFTNFLADYVNMSNDLLIGKYNSKL